MKILDQNLKKLIKAGQILSIELQDAIIIDDKKKYISYYDHCLKEI